MEKGPVSVSCGRRRGERMWMPEKAAGCKVRGFFGLRKWRVAVASGE